MRNVRRGRQRDGVVELLLENSALATLKVLVKLVLLRENVQRDAEERLLLLLLPQVQLGVLEILLQLLDLLACVRAIARRDSRRHVAGTQIAGTQNLDSIA